MPYLPKQTIGFVLPIFANQDRSQLFIQEPDRLENKIKRFVEIENSPINLRELNSSEVRNQGDSMCFVFLTKRSETLVGSIDGLRDRFLRAAHELDGRPDIQMQIFDLLGNEAEQFKARKSFLHFLSSRTASTTKTFIKSDIKHFVFCRLSEDSKAFPEHELLEHLRELRVEFVDGNKVSLTSGSSNANLILKLEQLRREIEALYGPILKSHDEIADMYNKKIPSNLSPLLIEQLTAEIGKVGRYEYRLAKLLQISFENPGVVLLLVSEARVDASKVFRAAMLHIRNAVSHRIIEDHNELKQILLSSAWHAFYHSLTPVKASFLLALYNTMPDDDLVNQFIRQMIRRSRSLHFGNVERAIERLERERHNSKK
ncbi:MAG: hypothetical protein M3O03_14910 [Pseudomonadota bacterium]|nr:hypothetical protein [Pseudomonadota bacterium]